jgi:Ca2+-binding EF-hand superfamily protein
MLSAETESRLSKLLLTLADGEAAVETTRLLLANQLGFDPYNLFRLLDTESKGWLDAVNIVDFLRRNSVFTGTFEAQQVIFHFDADGSGTLSYSEFLNLAVSERNTLLRNSNFGSSYRSYGSVPYDVEFSFVRLLEKEIDLVKNLNVAIRDLNLRYDFNVMEAFKSMDVYNLDTLNAEGLRKFLLRNFVTPSETDLVNIVRRLDLDRDYRVTYTELKKLVSAYSSGFTTYTSSNTYYSPERRTRYYSPERTYFSPYRTRLYCSPRRCYSPLRTYYSPPRTIVPYSSIISTKRDSPKNMNLSNLNQSLNQTKTNSPLRNTVRSVEVISRSPQRVNSPPRTKTGFYSSSNENNFNLSTKVDLNSSVISSTNRYLSYEEEVFQNYLRDLIAVESNVEINKNEVALKSDFNMEDVFSVFEKYRRGFVSEFDLKDGLNGYFGVFPLLEEISTLFKRYDTEKNGSLRYL